MSFKRLIVCTALVWILLSSTAYGQKAIELRNENGRSKIINVGKRVKYKLRNGFEDAGRIQSIGDSSLVINDMSVNVKDIIRFGKKGAGSNFWGIFLTSLGGLGVITIIQNQSTDNTPQCPSCVTTTTSRQPVGGAIALGLVMTGVGVTILSNNTMKNLWGDWSIHIVDQKK